MKRMLLDGLLIKPQEVTATVGDKKVAMWCRPPRDPDRTMATALARKASRSLRKLLEDRESEEFSVLVQDELEGADENTLRQVWVNGKLIPRAIEIRQQSLEDREYVPNPLDDEERTAVSPKEMDKYEDKVDEVEEDREFNVMRAISQANTELAEEAKKIKQDDLFEAAIPQMIESLCEDAYQLEFVSQIIKRCTFEDKKLTRPVFESVEQVYDLHTGLRAQLVLTYQNMMSEPEAVKN